MPQFLLGQAVRLATGTITNDAGPADPATLALTITLPDLTTIPISLAGFTRISAGVYQYDYLPTQAGHHTWRIVATGPNTAAEGAFDVAGAGLQAVIGLDEAKASLRITSDTTDDELRLYLSATTTVIEKQTGPVVPRTVTETLGALNTIILRQSPVMSVTSLVTATAVDLAGYFILDGEGGVLNVSPPTIGYPFSYRPYTFPGQPLDRLYSAGLLPFYPGQPVTVTYVAGRNPIPSAIQLAARIILEELWSARRAAGPLPARGGDSQQVPVPGGGGYGIPDSAAELLAPYARASAVG